MSHSILAPSGAKTWINCNASPLLILANQDRIRETETEYSKEGTLAHDWASRILTGDAMLGDITDKSMKLHVGSYVEFCEKLIHSETYKDAEVLIEEKVPLFYRKQDNGTIDFALLTDNRVYIVDLKYGAGVAVEAQGNYQAAIYALSLIQEYSGVYSFNENTLITIAIYQPRNYEGSPAKLWVVSLGDLRKEYGLIIETNAQLIQEEIENFSGDEETIKLGFHPEIPGACTFCDAKLFCKARAAHVANEFKQTGLEVVSDVQESNIKKPLKAKDLPKRASLTDAQIACVVENGPELVKWINSIVKDANTFVESGGTIEGLKQVAGGLGNRSWTDEEKAERFLKNQKIPAADLFTKKLVSPTQAEKLLKGKDLSTKAENIWNALVVRPIGKPVLVPLSDPREPIKALPDELENLDQEAESGEDWGL